MAIGGCGNSAQAVTAYAGPCWRIRDHRWRRHDRCGSARSPAGRNRQHRAWPARSDQARTVPPGRPAVTQAPSTGACRSGRSASAQCLSARMLPAATVTELPGAGHEALDTAPDLLVAEVLHFLGDEHCRVTAAACAAGRAERHRCAGGLGHVPSGGV